MYFVDREELLNRLAFFDQQLELLENIYSWQTDWEKRAIERITQLIIEVFLDVGNDMIDGFIMRDPGSYEDIVEILTDEKVITDEMSVGFKKIVAYRKILVGQYTELDHNELVDTFQLTIPILKQFAPMVRAYLHNQLGPVSAFKN